MTGRSPVSPDPRGRVIPAKAGTYWRIVIPAPNTVIPAYAGMTPHRGAQALNSPSPYKGRGRRDAAGRGYCGQGA